MKHKLLSVLLAALLIFAATACTSNSPAGTDSSVSTSSGESASAPESDATAYKGGVLKVAMASASPFSGIFNPAFTSHMADADISYWMTEPLLLIGEDLQYNQDGAATYTYDKDAKTMTLTMKPNVKWHDGMPVAMEDFVYAYEVIASPDYFGYFFTETMSYITGIMDYQQGAADSISGFALSDDKNSVTIQFDVFMPSILEGGLWSFPLPKHQFDGVSIADMEADERSRNQFIGFGPFKIANVVPGELVEMERFDDYWQGVPKLDGVSIAVVNPDMVPSAMEQGLYDVSSFPAEAYADYQNPTNYSYLSAPDQWYQYTGFRLGHFDGAAGENKTNASTKMSNLNLRKAIGHAVDLESICNDFYNGLYGLNPTILSPNFAVYINPAVTGYAYDPEQAKSLLDEAGYADIDGDGFREDINGNPLVINWAVPNNNAETVVQYKLQCWRDIGLNVNLLTGNMIEMNAYYDRLFSDDAEIDMFEVGWILEESPKLSGSWGRNSIVNFPRFVSEEMDALLNALDSDEAWDKDYRIKAYYDIEQYFFEQTPAIPTVWRSFLYAVNNRVENFTVNRVYNACDKYLIELTQENTVAK